MGSYQIKTTLNLDTGAAKDKIKALNNEKVKVKVDADVSKVKSALKGISAAGGKGENIFGMRASTFSSAFDKDLKDYRKLLNKRGVLERQYLNASKKNEKENIEEKLRINQDAIKASYVDIMQRAKSTGDYIKAEALDNLTASTLGKNAFNRDRSAVEMLRDWKNVGDTLRDTRKILNGMDGDITKKVMSGAKGDNEQLLKRVNDYPIDEEKRSLLERRAANTRKMAEEGIKLSRKELEFEKALSKARIDADKIENKTLSNKAHARLDKIEKMKNSMSLNRHPSDIAKSFEGFTSGVKDFSISIDKMQKDGRRIESTFSSIQKRANKLGDGLHKINNPISEAFKDQYLERVSKLQSDLGRDDRSAGFVRKMGNRTAALEKHKKIIKEINSMENTASGKYSRVQNQLSSFSNIGSRYLADKYSEDLSKSFNNINTGKLESTHRNLMNFNKELRRTGESAKKIGVLDRALNNLDMHESALRPKQVNEYRRQLGHLIKNGDVNDSRFEAQVRRVDTNIKRAVKVRGGMQKFAQDFKSSFMGSSMGYLAGYGLRKSLGDGLRAYKELDASMVNVKKVAADKDVQTVQQIRGITKQAISVAKEVGVSSAEVQNSLATSLQSGMGSMKESFAVARKAMVLSNIGDMNKDEATKGINTIVKSYNLEPLKKQRVQVKGLTKETTELAHALDYINWAGNHYAISESGVVQALQKGGGVFHAYGIGLKDSVAMVTAANEALQDPKKVGNGLRTIAMRIAGISADAKKGNVELNVTGRALKTIAGIDVYSDRKKGQIKSVVTILDEVRGKWKSLNDDEQKALAEAISGKNRADVFASLMNNYDTFNKIRKEFSEGAEFGSAEKENAQAVDSFAGKINKLKETFTSMVSTMVSSKAIYAAVDGFTALAGVIEQIIQFGDKHNVQLPLMAAGLAGYFSLIKGVKTEIVSMGDILYGGDEQEGQVKKQKRFISKLADAYKEGSQKYKGQSKKGLLSSLVPDKAEEQLQKRHKKRMTLRKPSGEDKDLRKNFKLLDLNTKGIEKLEKAEDKGEKTKKKHRRARRAGLPLISEEIKSHKKLGETLKAERTSVEKAGKGISKLGSGLKGGLKGIGSFLGGGLLNIGGALLGGVATMALSAGSMLILTKALEVGAKKYGELKHGVEDARQAHIKSRDALVAENKGIKSNIDYVKKNAKAINSLHERKKAILAIDKDKRSNEQNAELVKIQEMESRIAKMSPSSVIRYDEDGNPILKANLSAESLIKNLSVVQKQLDLATQNKNNQIYADNIKKMFDGEKIGEGAIQKVKRLNKEIKAGINASKKLDKVAQNVTMNGRVATVETNPELSKAYQGLTKEGFWSKHSNTKYTDRMKSFNKAYKKWETDMNKKFTEANKAFAEYDNLNSQNTQIQLSNMQNLGMFKGLSADRQGSAQNLGSLYQWGKIRPGDATVALKGVIDIAKKANPKDIDAFTNSVIALKEAYSMDKDYSTYSSGIDKLTEDLGKKAGLSKKEVEKLATNVKDIERTYTDLDEAMRLQYMKNRGAKMSDTLNDDSKGLYAQQVAAEYNAISNAQKQWREAQSANERRNIIESMAEDDNLSSGMKRVAKLFRESDGGTLTDAKSNMFEKIMRSATDFNPKLDSSIAKMNELKKSLENGGDKAVDFGNGVSFSAAELKKMHDMGITGKDIDSAFKGVDSGLYKGVDDFYKNYKTKNGESLEIDAKIKMDLADLNLAKSELEGMEKTIESLGMSKGQANTFREQAGKYWVGTNGDSEKFYQNLSSDDMGQKIAVTNGLSKQVGKYSDEVLKLGNSYDLLNEKMRQSADALPAAEFKDFVATFGQLSSSMQKFANDNNITSVTALKNIGGFEKSALSAGVEQGTIEKAVNVVYTAVGAEKLGEITDVLNQLPDEKRVTVITELAGAGGDAKARGLGFLKDAGLSDQKVSMVIQAVLEKDGNLNSLMELTQSGVKQFMVKYGVDNSEPEAARQTNEQTQNGKVVNTVDNSQPEGARQTNEQAQNGKVTNTVDNSQPEAARQTNEQPQQTTLQVVPEISQNAYNIINDYLGEGKTTTAKIDVDVSGISEKISSIEGKIKVSVDVADVQSSLAALAMAPVKVPLQADTSVIDGAVKGYSGKIKIGVDTGSIQGALAALSLTPIKVPVQVDTSGIGGKMSGLGKGQSIKVTVTADTTPARAAISSLSGAKTVSVTVTADTSSAQAAINGLKGKTVKVNVVVGKMPSLPKMKGGTISVKATDGASAPAKKATAAVKGFPTGSKKIVLRAIDSASGPAKRATAAVNAFPTGSKTIRLITRYETKGSKPSGASGGGSDLGLPDNSIIAAKVKKIQALKDGLLPKVTLKDLFRRPTQMNPLATGGIGTAGATDVGGVTTGSITVGGGPVAANSPAKPILDVVSALSTFQNFNFKALEYKGVSSINRLSYSFGEWGKAIKHDVDLLREAKEAVNRVSASVKYIEAKKQRLRGSSRISMINLEQDALREEYRRLTVKRDLEDKKKLFLRGELQKFEVKFSGDNPIPVNYGSILTKLKEEMEALEKQKAGSKGKGGKKLNEQQLEEKKKANQLKQKQLEEYMKTVNDIVATDTQRVEAQNKVGDLQDEKIKMQITSWKEIFDSMSKVMDASIKKITDTLDIYETKVRFAFGRDKIELMKAQISTMEDLNHQYRQNAVTLENKAAQLRGKLATFGFTFGADGKMDNYVQNLATLEQTSTVYSEVKGLANDYMDIVNNKLPEATKQQEVYNSKIKEVNKTLLEDTRAVEEKVTAMYKKQIDERIKALEKETRKKNELLQKQKDAYLRARKEADYQDDINEKNKELRKLERKRDIYSKDTSQRGQKELQKINEEIERQTKEFKKLVNRHADEEMSKIFDDEMKMGEKEIEIKKEYYEKEYSDINVQKKVQEAIQSGVWYDIDNKAHNLQSALIGYINEFEGGLSATGAIIKGEIIAKLEEANEVVKNFSSILSNIGVSDFGTGSYVQNGEYASIKSGGFSQENSYYSPLVYVNGAATDELDKKVFNAVKAALDEQNRYLRSNIR